jgi:protein-tyrosine phosphatase
VNLTSVNNCRDFGGQPASDGRRVRRDVLYRSGHLGALSEDDLERLAALDFAVVVDLRRAAERGREVSRRPASFRGKVLEHAAPLEAATAPHLAFLTMPDATPQTVLDHMTQGYRGYPYDPWYAAMYRDYFAELARLDGRLLVHCHAGKDRTGVLCALTLHVLGVSRDDIFEDYLLTNQRGGTDARMAEMQRRFQRDHGRPAAEDLMHALMQAQATYLEAAFDAMTSEYGSVEGYLERHIGVTEATIAEIRERLLT